jgi:epoxyqueuosine reductase
MSKKLMNRRDFLHTMGISAAGVGAVLTAPKLVGETTKGIVVESEKEYGGFLVEKLNKENLPYQYNPEILKRMQAKYTIFSRNLWDPLRKDRPETKENLTKEDLVKGEGKVPNRTRLDYAFMAASWFSASVSSYYKWEVASRMINGMGLPDMGPWNPGDLDMNWEDASLVVKHAAQFYGASLAGIAELNPLWIYSNKYSPKKEQLEHSIPVLSEGDRFEQTEDAWYIPKSMNRVIAIGFEEDFSAIANSPGKIASAAVGDGYSRMAVTASTLAEFIKGLGYRAIPAGNGVGLSIPMAIDAGLGELGRQGLLVTPKYGPRVRLAKVITDMPLQPDNPIEFGVTEFCESCMLCADHCPGGSITKGSQTWEGKSPSNNNGTYKWYVDAELCYDFNGFSCSNCKRVCPFNKPNNSWLHQMTRQIIKGRLKVLNKAMVNFDQASGYGEQLQGSDFWKFNGEKCITSRESM